MSWSHEQINVLIESYERHPCLYVVKHKDYHNKHKRSLALSKILDEISILRPASTAQELNKKFLGLRTTYANERKKVLESMHSGMGEDEVYHPSLWYYEKMGFLNDHLQMRTSRTSYSMPEEESEIVPEAEDEIDFEEMETSQNNIEFYELSDEGVSPSPSPLRLKPFRKIAPLEGSSKDVVTLSSRPTSKSTIRKKPLEDAKRQRRTSHSQDKELEVLANISEGLNRVTGRVNEQKSAEDAFGEFVAAQLKKIKDENVKLVAQFNIHKIILDALKE